MRRRGPLRIMTPGYIEGVARRLPPRLRAHEIPEGCIVKTPLTGRCLIIAERAREHVYAWDLDSGAELILHPNVVLEPRRGAE